MHGELMEFNESLHKQILAKEKVIRNLQDELTDLRGPVRHRVHTQQGKQGKVIPDRENAGNLKILEKHRENTGI